MYIFSILLFHGAFIYCKEDKYFKERRVKFFGQVKDTPHTAECENEEINPRLIYPFSRLERLGRASSHDCSCASKISSAVLPALWRHSATPNGKLDLGFSIGIVGKFKLVILYWTLNKSYIFATKPVLLT